MMKHKHKQIWYTWNRKYASNKIVIAGRTGAVGLTAPGADSNICRSVDTN